MTSTPPIADTANPDCGRVHVGGVTFAVRAGLFQRESNTRWEETVVADRGAVARGGSAAVGQRFLSAQRYATLGWPVLPVHSSSRGVCSCGAGDCGSPGKHPVTARGVHDASVGPAQLRRWWQRYPDANVAVATGGATRLLVVDVDRTTGGAASWIRLVRGHAPIQTLTAVTGGGGRHFYYRLPGGLTLGNSVARLGEGIDTRSDGGYVIAPPSRHPSGQPYRWLHRDRIETAPDWLTAALAAPEVQRSAAPVDVAHLDRWVQAALDQEAQRVADAPVGTRNATLNRAAYKLGQLAGAGMISDDCVRTHLGASATRAGLQQREIERTITSGLTAGRATPRRPRTRETRSREVTF